MIFFNKSIAYNYCKMREKFYFCFQFYAITLQNNIQEDLAAMTKFQIQIIKNQKAVAHTHNILCSPDQQGVIHIPNETLRFTLSTKPNQLIKHSCEIRLLEMIPGGQRPIGSYQFLLDNYIQASKDLHRSCMQMKVEIGQNFILDYVVYLESTIEALEKIVKEHEMAKKLELIDHYEEQQFLPQELQNTFFQQQIIKYDLESPLIIRQKYWSPKKKRQNQSGLNLKQLTSIEQQLLPSTSPKKPRKLSFIKLKKTPSLLSDNTANTIGKKRFLSKEKKLGNEMEREVDMLAEQQDIAVSNQQLYDVICSDSRVKVSPVNSDNQGDIDPKLSPLHIREHCQLRKSNLWNKNNLKSWIMIILLLMIVYILIGSIKGSKSHKNKKIFGKRKGEKIRSRS